MITQKSSNRQLKSLYKKIENVLSLDLLSPQYRRCVKPGMHPTTGHCAIAAETVYFLLGGKKAGLKALVASYKNSIGERETHWWVENEAGKKFDPTKEQYTSCGEEPPYFLGRATGFQGIRYNRGIATPSKRVRVILSRLKGKI